LFHLGHIRPFPHPLVKRQVLIDANQTQTLTSRSLKEKVRIRPLQPPDTEIENSSGRFFHVGGFDLQPDRSEASQELTLIRNVSVEKRDVEVLSQADEIPFGILLGDFPA